MRRQRLDAAVAARKRRRLCAAAGNAAPRAALPDSGALCGVAGFLDLHALVRFVTVAPACNHAVLALRGVHVRVDVHAERTRVRRGAVAQQVVRVTLWYEGDTHPPTTHERFTALTLVGGAQHADTPGATHVLIALDDITSAMPYVHTLDFPSTGVGVSLDLRVLPRWRHARDVHVSFKLLENDVHARPFTQLPRLRAIACGAVHDTRNDAWGEWCAQPRAWTSLRLIGTCTQTLDSIATGMPQLTRLSLRVSSQMPTYDDARRNVCKLAAQLTSLNLTDASGESRAVSGFVRNDLRAFARLTELSVFNLWHDGATLSDDLASALPHLVCLRELRVHGHCHSLAFVASLPPTARTVVLRHTCADANVANLSALAELTQLHHLGLHSAFDVAGAMLSDVALMPFRLPLRARLLPQLLTFECM